MLLNDIRAALHFTRTRSLLASLSRASSSRLVVRCIPRLPIAESFSQLDASRAPLDIALARELLLPFAHTPPCESFSLRRRPSQSQDLAKAQHVGSEVEWRKKDVSTQIIIAISIWPLVGVSSHFPSCRSLPNQPPLPKTLRRAKADKQPTSRPPARHHRHTTHAARRDHHPID